MILKMYGFINLIDLAGLTWTRRVRGYVFGGWSVVDLDHACSS